MTQGQVAGLALLEHGQERRGDEDRGVGAGPETDEQRQGELLEGGGTEHERADHQKRGDRQQGGDGRVEGAHEHLVQGVVHHLAVGGAAGGGEDLGILVDLVEHHDAVVDRVAEDGQDGDDRGRRDLEPGEGVDPDGDEDVVHQGGEGGQGHLPLEAHGDVQGDGHEEERQRPLCLAGDLRAPRRAHLRDLHVGDVQPGELGQGAAHLVAVGGVARLRLDPQPLALVLTKRLDLDIGQTDRRQGLAGLTDRHVGGHHPRAAALEVDTEVEPPGGQPPQADEDDQPGDGEPQLLATDEVDVGLAVVEAAETAPAVAVDRGRELPPSAAHDTPTGARVRRAGPDTPRNRPEVNFRRRASRATRGRVKK